MILYKNLLITLLVIVLFFYIKITFESFYEPFINKNINSFELTKYKLLFFDIFYKNSKLYLIAPLYNQDISFVDKIYISLNNKKLNLIEKYFKKTEESIAILVYDIPNKSSFININVSYKNKINNYYLQHITSTNDRRLSLTTLFKYDLNLFDTFYNYYKNQGVDEFFIYYNGKIDENVKNKLNKNDIHLIEWNFRYWNDISCKFKNHAQVGQMHHAIYKYGKDNYNYMIFCNLDEYMLSPHRKLVDMIYTNYDTYGFNNYYCDCGSLSFSEVPNKFKISEMYNFGNKSKCIHKLDSIRTVGINKGYEYKCIHKIYVRNNNYLFNFYKLNNSNKLFNCYKFIDISNLRKLLYFIHIPKTGGSMIEDVLLENGYIVSNKIRILNELDRVIKVNNIKCSEWHVPPKHKGVNFNDYITFTIIREPISRFISELNWHAFPSTYKFKFKNINDFIKNYFLYNKKISYDGDCHLVPQYEYLYDVNSNKVNNIFNQNNLNQDFDFFIKKYNLDVKINYSKVNPSKKKYTISDINDENINLIKDFYRMDYNLF